MAGTRFATAGANVVIAVPATIKNGTGGGAPPLVQDAAYPMSNLLLVDRYTVWATGAAAPSPHLVHLDLGFAYDISFVGLLGIRYPNPGSGPSLVEIGSRTTYSVTQGDYTIRSTQDLAGHPVDPCAAIATVAARYWQLAIYDIDTTFGFSLGKPMLGSLDQDLGSTMVYSPGATVRRVQPGARTEVMDGAPVVSYLGLPYKLFALPFRMIQTVVKTKLDTIAQQTDPLVYFDQFNVATECLAEPEYEVTHQWAPGDLWDMTLRLRGLG